MRFGDAYAAEMDAFVDLVAGEGPNRCPGAAAADALRLALAADISLAEGRVVPVDASTRQTRHGNLSVPESDSPGNGPQDGS